MIYSNNTNKFSIYAVIVRTTKTITVFHTAFSEGSFYNQPIS